uniref:Uncharacterized protein n=1 Tax=Romanomermis culicivorax TaxID=13658 RepID=A0A915I4T9_ROMCU
MMAETGGAPISTDTPETSICPKLSKKPICTPVTYNNPGDNLCRLVSMFLLFLDTLHSIEMESNKNSSEMLRTKSKLGYSNVSDSQVSESGFPIG